MPPKETKPAYNISSLPTLKGFSAGAQKKETEETANTVNEAPPEPIGIVSFEAAWNEYMDILRNQSKKVLSAFFERVSPNYNNTDIFIIEAPKMTASMLEDERQDMLIHLRRRTGNTSLNLQVVITQVETETTPYTNKEKFDSLVQKNPKLLDLKNALDLELE